MSDLHCLDQMLEGRKAYFGLSFQGVSGHHGNLGGASELVNTGESRRWMSRGRWARQQVVQKEEELWRPSSRDPLLPARPDFLQAPQPLNFNLHNL